MRIYVRNVASKFHPDPIWNHWALGFFEEQKEEEKEQDA